MSAHRSCQIPRHGNYQWGCTTTANWKLWAYGSCKNDWLMEIELFPLLSIKHIYINTCNQESDTATFAERWLTPMCSARKMGPVPALLPLPSCSFNATRTKRDWRWRPIATRQTFQFKKKLPRLKLKANKYNMLILSLVVQQTDQLLSQHQAMQ